MHLDISAIIVAKDKPPYIFETIDSLKGLSSEIVIIDIGINKELKNKLSSNPTIKLIEFGETVDYVELIREKSKKFAKYDYLLFIDPDEVISIELKKLLIIEVNNYDYIKIPRKNIIFDKWIKHSRWWPDYQIRLFKKDKVIWPTQIHRQPIVKGKEFVVPQEEKCALIHHNYQNLDEYLSKTVRYAKAEAENLIITKPDFSLSDSIKKAISEFISRYFADSGYKDGMHGFVLSILQMFYYFLVYFYYWEIKKYQLIDEKDIIKQSSNFFLKGYLETNYWIKMKKLIKNNGLISKIKNSLLNKLVD